MNKQEVVKKLTTIEKDFELFNGFYEYRALHSDINQLKQELANRGFEFKGVYPIDSSEVNKSTLIEVIAVWAARTKTNLDLVPVSTAHDINIRNTCKVNVEDLLRAVDVEGVEGGEMPVEESNPAINTEVPEESSPESPVSEAVETIEEPVEEPKEEPAEKVENTEEAGVETPAEPEQNPVEEVAEAAETVSEEKPKRRRKKSEE